MRTVQTRSNLWLGKIQLITIRSETLIPSKVLLLGLHTLLSGAPPLLEELKEGLFGNEIQLGLGWNLLTMKQLKAMEKTPLINV